MKIASAPDMMDDLNQLSLMLFKKPLKDLTDDEYDRLQEYAEEKLAMGGRAGFADGTDNKFSGGENNRVRELLLKEETEGLSEDEKEELRQLIKTISAQGPMSSDQEGIMMAKKGGRVGLQTGGITEQRVLPPEFIEAAQRTFLTDLATQSGLPSVTTATTQQPGETAAQFAQRQAQATQFGITRAGMAELAPQVAAQDPLQAAAYAQAIDPTKGLGSYQPYLTAAGQAATGATALTGTGAGTGAGSIQSYMSPYQQQVIDTTMADYDAQAAKSRLGLGAQAVAGGAFGSGRQGIAEAEFDALSNRGRSTLQSNLRQTGFENAQRARQQDLANQMGLSNLQTGLGEVSQGLGQSQIAGLGALGSAQQAQNQAILDSQRQFATMAVQDPINRLNMLVEFFHKCQLRLNLDLKLFLVH